MRRGQDRHLYPALLATAIALALGPLAASAGSPQHNDSGAIPSKPQSGPDPAQQCGPFPLAAMRIGLQEPGQAGGARTEVRSTEVRSSDGNLYVLDGDVRLDDGEQILRAGHVEWQRDSGLFRARDDVRYQNGNLLLTTPGMQGNSASGTGSAGDVRFRMLGSTGNGQAGGIRLLGDERSRLESVRYSTCSPARRSWELRAARIDIDQSRDVGYARNVSLRLGDVPILWFPWLRFPTSDARHSGLLYPTLGYDESRGFDITVPWYLNLAPNMDATLYPRILGRRGFMLGAEFRYLTTHSRGAIRADYLAHDRIEGSSRGLLRARSTTELGNNWRFNVNLNHVSDRSYFEDLGNSLYSNATHLLRSQVYLSGRGHGWHALVGADKFQITDPTLPGTQEPYKRLPRAVFGAAGGIGAALRYGLDGEFVSFRKDAGLDGRRLDVEPWVDWNLQGPWWYFNPHVSWRYTGYRLDRATAASPSRALPIASIDTGLVFERAARWFGEGYTQTLEPRLYYLRAPYRDQSDIPIFDTSYQNFDYWQLFTPNRFSGADRQMNANNLTLALTSRLLDASGAERLAASIGQIRYFEPQRVQMPGRQPTDFSGSAYVAQLSTRLSDAWKINLAQQWNPNGNRTDLSTAAVQHSFGQRGVLNMAYRYRRGLLENVDFSTLYPISPDWSLVARWNYGLREGRTLAALAGFEYSNCCVAVRLVGRHYVRNSAGELNNSIMLEIEFKGIGSLGQNAGNLLHHAILGYRPNDFAALDTLWP